MAFSVGAALPGWFILTLTAALTIGLGSYLWRDGPAVSRPASLALAGVVGGAAANLIDRVRDGVVTDYLHTGWWPTFNLADALIVTGGILAALLSLRSPETGDPRHRCRRWPTSDLEWSLSEARSPGSAFRHVVARQS